MISTVDAMGRRALLHILFVFFSGGCPAVFKRLKETAQE